MVYYKNTSRLDIRIGDLVFKKGEVTAVDRYITHKGLMRISITEAEQAKKAKQEKEAKAAAAVKVKAPKGKSKKLVNAAPVNSEPSEVVEAEEDAGNK